LAVNTSSAVRWMRKGMAPVVTAVSSMASEAITSSPKRGRRCSRQMRLTMSPVE
jgi:hypothetical protein